MTTTQTDVKILESEHVLQTYKRQPVVFERGAGMHLFDDQGRRYLDFLSGIGVASLGHAHPALAKAIGDQAATLAHTSNLYFHPLQGELAARLSALTGIERAFFCNSGTEANEACLKFARRYWHTKGDTARTKYVAFKHSFHGRTMGSLSVTWDEHYRGPFQPLIPGVSFADPSDPASVTALVDGTTAAIIFEPVQGEGGVRPMPAATIQAIKAAVAKTGTLVIADEVQSGCGRTGNFLGSQTIGLTPDLVALGKALGGGFPIGAAMVSGKVAETIFAGDHGTTYGGNLLACRAALVFLSEYDRALAANVREMSAHLMAGLNALKSKYPVISEVRGLGLIAGLDFSKDPVAVLDGARTRGLLVNRTSNTVIRLLPPFVVSKQDIDEALGVLDAAIAAAFEGSAA